MFVVYVLRSLSTGNLYIGQTRDLAKRITDHNAGVAQYTRNRGPWELIVKEEHATRSEAVRRERFLKTGRGRDWLKASIRQ